MSTNRKPNRSAVAKAVCAVLMAATPAYAQTNPNERATKTRGGESTPATNERSAGPERPRLHHAPPSVAPAGEALTVKADIVQPHLVKNAWLVYRATTRGPIQTTPFRRASDGPYLAIVPAEQVEAPALYYAIELETVEGKRVQVFASRNAMFRVSVPAEYDDLRERALLERLDGRRSEVTTSAEYVLFGSTDATIADPVAGTSRVEGIQDRYYRIESGYTYRPLGTVAEFSIRLGLVRGRSVVPGETDTSQFDVGLNYGSPRVRFRIDDALHVETGLLTSVTEVGFSLGAGGAVLVGDPYGTHLTFGFETVQTFGTRMFSRMDIAASDRVMVAPVIELTDMPHADRYGVRLMSEVAYDAGAGVRLAARGGYQARTFTSGGPSVGTSLSYAF
jgi:hypothetical protein